MRLIISELKKSFLDIFSYYPDYIVSSIIDIGLLYFILQTDGNKETKIMGYCLWLLCSGVLSEASINISFEKQNGTLQNLMTKTFSILEILLVKSIIWFFVNLVKMLLVILLLSFFMNISRTISLFFLFIIVMVGVGIMGLSLILCSLTLIFTKVASFISIINYALLFFSGSIMSVSKFVMYSNPLSFGVKTINDLLSGGALLNDYVILSFISLIWFVMGLVIFKLVFSRSKQFKWTY